jgi:hypothetical protein
LLGFGAAAAARWMWLLRLVAVFEMHGVRSHTCVLLASCA